MDPVDLIIASLHIKGAFLNTPWLLLEAVWKRLGLPFYNFASGYIRTRKYTVRTGAGLTPFLEPGSGVPQRRNRRPLPVPSRDAPPGPRNQAGLPGLRTLPPPLPPGWASRTTPTLRSHTPHTNPMPRTPD